MDKIRAYVLIKGFVYPVMFLLRFKEISDKNDLRGWARNTWEGNVEAILEGDKRKIDEILTSFRRDMPFVQISEIETTWQDFTGEFEGFSIEQNEG